MGVLDFIIILLVLAWLGGFSLHLAGSFIHLLLVIAIIVLIVRLFQRAV